MDLIESGLWFINGPRACLRSHRGTPLPLPLSLGGREVPKAG